MEDLEKIKRLPPYVFAEVNRLKDNARSEGKDIIDFGMGNPDIPTPRHIVEKLIEAIKDPKTHRYSASRGITGLRKAQAEYYERRFNVKLDFDTEVIVTLGSKGLVFFHKNEITFIKGKTVDAVDTVGSGDCFVGALSYSLLKGNSIRDSCEFANKSAAISVTKKGAAASMPNIGEIKRFFHS